MTSQHHSGAANLVKAQRSEKTTVARMAILGFAMIAAFSSVPGLGQPQPAVLQLPLPLDLIADQGLDPNGLPLNPQWGYQETSQGVVRDARDVCNPQSLQPFARPVVINPACTSQSPGWDSPDPDNGFPGLNGGWWSDRICGQDASPFEGHSNWRSATYTGVLSSFDKSDVGADDDYSIDLVNADGRGGLAGDSGHIHLEFDSDETIDHFSSQWWTDFHSAADDGNLSALIRINGAFAIASGLIGIDWVHTPGTESHPVWALFIRLAEGEWVFFVRNWGNEGFCSTYSHSLDNLPGGAFTVKIPWAHRSILGGVIVAATDVTIPTADLRIGGDPAPQGQVTGAKIFGDGVLLSFPLGSPDANGYWEGSFNLAWQFPPGTSPPPPPPPPPPPLPHCNKVVHPPDCDPGTTENRVARLLRSKLSKQQIMAITAILKEPGGIMSQPRVSKPEGIHLETLHHLPSPPVRVPSERAVFDEKHDRQDRLRLAALCAAFKDSIPQNPKACSPLLPARQRPKY